MSQALIIVESPTKVKTIKKFLGPEYNVMATMGHVKDLPKKDLGIEIERDFRPTYEVMPARKKTIDELKKAARKCKHIYLAPDPDREGEAIAWHIADEVQEKGKTVHRVLFNDLTRHTVLEAIEHPLELDLNKYEAQQTRRILDRLVGYKISPLLWDRVRRGLSAGRVQSVAVRLICDREREIQKFKPEEYWNIAAFLQGTQPPPLEAKLLRIHGKKAKIGSHDEAETVLSYLRTHPFTVEKVDKKETRRSPQPPFTTSKLQQEASRALNFSSKKTMTVAQRLYEGISLGNEGPVGLITYMRTDSVRIAQEALQEAREFIRQAYEPPYLPARPNFYKTANTAQDAHEAIRPSTMTYRPQDIQSFLGRDEFRLYQLIWNRFVASQMTPAVFDLTTIDIACGPYILRAQGSIMKFPGFTIVYTERKDDNGQEGDEGIGKILPGVSLHETLDLQDLKAEQKFSQPPPRFTEASLVRELEEKGIGRPSTYATIMSTIQDREYVRLLEKKFHPTELGVIVTDLLVRNFPKVLDVAFTADMETKLDQIEQGQLLRLDTLKAFYDEFSQELSKAEGGMEKVKGEGIATDQICEKCGSPMVIKLGKNGEFLACSNYPACKNTRNFSRAGDGSIVQSEPLPAAQTDIPCDKCGKPMVVKEGRYGPFLGCSGYPSCKHIVNIARNDDGTIRPVKEETTDAVCEKCGRPMMMKRGRYGPFLGCSGYPECRNIVNLKKTADGTIQAETPQTTDAVCDKCGRPMVMKRGRFGPFLSCSGYPECRNIVNLKKNKEAPETEPPQLTDVACDKFGRPMAVKKGRYGPFLACTGYPDCKNIMKMKDMT